MISLLKPIYEYLTSEQSLEDYNNYYEVRKKLRSIKEIDERTLEEQLHFCLYTWLYVDIEEPVWLLEDVNLRYSPDISTKNFFFRSFYLTLIHHSRLDIERMNSNYDQAFRYWSQLKEKPITDEKFWLFGALVNTSLELKEANKNAKRHFYNWLESDIKNIIDDDTKFSIYLYFGTWLRELEEFNEGKKIVNLIEELENNNYQKFLFLNNLGAFEYKINEFDNAYYYYKKAKKYLSKYLKENSSLEQYSQNLLKEQELNLKDIKYKKDIIEERITHERIDFEISDFAEAERSADKAIYLLNDELYQEKVRKKGSLRFSNAIYSAIKYFNKAELIYNLMGLERKKRGLLKLQVRSYINVALENYDKKLQVITLEQAIKINEEKAIDRLLGDKIPFKTNEELDNFCDWLLQPKCDYLFKLGQINCLKNIEDYLPKKYLTTGVELIESFIKEQWSFIKEYDIKRPAILTLGNYLRHMNGSSLERNIKKLFGFFREGNFFIQYEILKALSGNEWFEKVDDNFKKEIISEIKEIIEEVNINKDLCLRLYDIKVKITNKLIPEENKKLASYLEKQFFEGENPPSIELLATFPYRKYFTHYLITNLTNEVLNKVDEEIKEESPKEFGIGGPMWGAILIDLLEVAENGNTKTISKKLSEYIKSTNIMPYKRFLVISLYADKIKNGKLESPNKDIIQECQNFIFKRTFTNAKGDGVHNNLWDYNLLHIGAIKLFIYLNKIENKDIGYIINKLLESSLRGSKEAQKISIITMSILVAENQEIDDLEKEKVYWKLINERNNESEEIRAVTAYWLTALNIKLKINMEFIKELAEEPSKKVRYYLALGIYNNKSSWNEYYNIIEILKKDFSGRIRTLIGEVLYNVS